jgi:hypothetical protein
MVQIGWTRSPPLLADASSVAALPLAAAAERQYRQASHGSIDPQRHD